MSLVEIDRKAITDEDAQGVLDASYEVRDPFGIRAYVFRPEHYDMPQYGFAMPIAQQVQRGLMKRRIRRELSASFSKHYPVLLERYYVGKSMINGLMPYVVLNAVARGREFPSASGTPPTYNGKDKPWAHEVGPDDYEDHPFCIVWAPRQDLTGRKFVRSGLGLKRPVEIPNNPHQWQYSILWHEFAHGTGAAEPQADAMSAIMSRRAYSSTSVLKAFADHRAIKAVMGYRSRDNRRRYGWGTVEACDYVARMPEATVSGLSEGDIRDIRFQQFRSLSGAIFRVGLFLQNRASAAFQRHDFEMLRLASQRMRGLKGIGEDEQHILRRFELACARFDFGEVAYDYEEDVLPTELLESAQAKPHTFESEEFLPSAD